MTLVSCGTVPRPDLPVVKQAGKVYEQYQSTLCGVPLGKPKRRAVPSKMDKTQAVLRVPAKWLLWLALPAAALAGAVCLVATIYLQNVKLAKLCAVGAGALFLAALFATAWLIATTWMWVFAPLLALLLISTVVVAYKLTKGTRPTLLQQSYG